jgi:hypothetical protein
MGIHAIEKEKTTPCQVCAAPLREFAVELFEVCDCGWEQDGTLTDDFAPSAINGGMTIAQAQCHLDADGYTDPDMQELGEPIAQYGKELLSELHHRMKNRGHVRWANGKKRKKAPNARHWGGQTW